MIMIFLITMTKPFNFLAAARKSFHEINMEKNNSWLVPVIVMGVLIFLTLIIVWLRRREVFGIKEKRGRESIPRILIQTWKSSTLTNPVHIRCQRRLLNLHPDFKYLFFDDRQLDEFMETTFPEYNEFFTKTLSTRIQQIDFFRLCALYHYGGFYMDLDMYPSKDLSPLCRIKRFIVPVEHHLSIEKCKRLQRFGRYNDFDCYDRVTLGNYALASPPRNSELKLLIECIVKEYSSVNSKRLNPLVFVYTTTGPDKLTQVYYTRPEFRNNIYLLANRHTMAHFGDYAKHLAAGSWK